MSDQPPQRRKPPGCLSALAVAVALILIMKVYGYVQVAYQRAIWESRAPDSYVLMGRYVAIIPPAGKHILRMKNGRATLEDGWECNADCPFLPAHMFDAIQGCGIWFPLTICSVEYDPTYGFPSDYSTDCWLPGAECLEAVKVLYFAPLK